MSYGVSMNAIRDGWNTQLASDIQRDGMGLELLSPEGKVVAEVFRSDAEHTVTVAIFGAAIPAQVFDEYYRQALDSLDPFEDGTTFKGAGLPVA